MRDTKNAPGKATPATAKPGKGFSTPKPPPKEPEPEEVLVGGPNSTANLLELGLDRCRWNINDPRTPAFRYCGEPVHERGSTYCAKHHAEAYQLGEWAENQKTQPANRDP